MSTLIVHDSENPIQETDIAKVEKKLGAELPTDYREFLLTTNGGRPEPNIFIAHTRPGGSREVLAWFFCIKEDDSNDLLENVDIFQNRLPESLLPIATDPFGNIICLSIEGRDRGKVYFWDHEKEAVKVDPFGYDNVYFIADSFEEFLKSLLTSPE